MINNIIRAFTNFLISKNKMYNTRYTIQTDDNVVELYKIDNRRLSITKNFMLVIR